MQIPQFAFEILEQIGLMEEFSTTEAVKLLAAITDAGRVAAEPEAAERIVALCGHLPIAITLAARRLQARPSWRLAAATTLRANTTFLGRVPEPFSAAYWRR